MEKALHLIFTNLSKRRSHTSLASGALGFDFFGALCSEVVDFGFSLLFFLPSAGE